MSPATTAARRSTAGPRKTTRMSSVHSGWRGETSVDPTTNLALSSNGTEQNTTRLGVGQLVSTFGSNVVNELRGQVARETRPRLSNSEIPNLVTSFANIGAAGSATFSETRYRAHAPVVSHSSFSSDGPPPE